MTAAIGLVAGVLLVVSAFGCWFAFDEWRYRKECKRQDAIFAEWRAEHDRLWNDYREEVKRVREGTW